MYTIRRSATDELQQTYRSIRGELVRFARARTGDDADAEDVVQDVWLRLETRDPTPVANPRSYLFQIANNIALDRSRARMRRQQRDRLWCDWQTDFAEPGREVSDLDLDAEALLIERQEARRLHEAISQLPSGARSVLMLHKLEGLSHGQVADRLAISRSGVEKHMAVAMKHLRMALVE